MEVKFAKRLKEMREEKGLTITELGLKIGIAPNTVGRWEKGREAEYKNLIKLCLFFGCSADYLLGIKDNE